MSLRQCYEGGRMPRTTGQTRQELLNAQVARAKARLLKLEREQRQQQRDDLTARYIAIGEVVEACGLLAMDLGELEALLKLGLALQDEGTTTGEILDMRDNTVLNETRSE